MCWRCFLTSFVLYFRTPLGLSLLHSNPLTTFLFPSDKIIGWNFYFLIYECWIVWPLFYSQCTYFFFLFSPKIQSYFAFQHLAVATLGKCQSNKHQAHIISACDALHPLTWALLCCGPPQKEKYSFTRLWQEVSIPIYQHRTFLHTSLTGSDTWRQTLTHTTRYARQ